MNINSSVKANHAKHDRAQAYQLLRGAAQPDMGQLKTAARWLVLAAVLEALGPLLGKHLIDTYLLPRNASWDMAALLGGALIAGVAATWVRYFQLLRLAGLAMRSVQRIREQVYAHVLRLPMRFFDGAITGQLVSRVTNDTEAVKALYVQVLFVMLDSLITVGGIFAMMLWLHWRLALVAALLMPAVVLVVWGYQRISAPAVARARELRSDINAQMAESINGMTVLQASNATGRFQARFAQTAQAHYQSRQREVRANAWLLRPMLDFLTFCVLCAVILLFGFSGAGSAFGAIEVGLLYAFISFVTRMADPLINVTVQFSQFQQSVVAAARVNALLNEHPAPLRREGALIAQGNIAVTGLNFDYSTGGKPGPRVLHDINLQFDAGHFYGIVGHTGSGKSTLLSLLLRLYEAPPGTVLIDGAEIDSIGEAHFRQAVGLVPQEPFLLSASAFENINMGRGLSLAQCVAAAELAQAHGFIGALENGYDTLLGEGGARLSVGQKQLIAIARALALEPRVLLLDEATSHIDTETELAVQRALSALHGRITVIAIAHRLSTVRQADAIIVLDHGRVAQRGSHDALMQQDGGLYQRLVELQQIEVAQQTHATDATDAQKDAHDES